MERKATRKQLDYIRLLARKAGASLYLGNIRTLDQASRVIDALKRHDRNPTEEVRRALEEVKTTTR